MQREIINASRLIVDLDTVNRKYGIYNVPASPRGAFKICLFLGIIHIYFYHW